jgi:hypothetical protein
MNASPSFFFVCSAMMIEALPWYGPLSMQFIAYVHGLLSKN